MPLPPAATRKEIYIGPSAALTVTRVAAQLVHELESVSKMKEITANTVHVSWRVRTATLKWNDMIHDVAGTRAIRLTCTRAWIRFLELLQRLRTADDLAAGIARDTGDSLAVWRLRGAQ